MRYGPLRHDGFTLRPKLTRVPDAECFGFPGPRNNNPTAPATPKAGPDRSARSLSRNAPDVGRGHSPRPERAGEMAITTARGHSATGISQTPHSGPALGVAGAVWWSFLGPGGFGNKNGKHNSKQPSPYTVSQPPAQLGMRSTGACRATGQRSASQNYQDRLDNYKGSSAMCQNLRFSLFCRTSSNAPTLDHTSTNLGNCALLCNPAGGDVWGLYGPSPLTNNHR